LVVENVEEAMDAVDATDDFRLSVLLGLAGPADDDEKRRRMGCRGLWSVIESVRLGGKGRRSEECVHTLPRRSELLLTASSFLVIVFVCVDVNITTEKEWRRMRSSPFASSNDPFRSPGKQPPEDGSCRRGLGIGLATAHLRVTGIV
jgi:hypothetical protein